MAGRTVAPRVRPFYVIKKYHVGPKLLDKPAESPEKQNPSGAEKYRCVYINQQILLSRTIRTSR